MDCVNNVIDVCKKYPELKDYAERIKEVMDEPVDVKIALLGEFNSGKTTLVNALLRRDLLPMFSTPTTAAITEIYATEDNEIKVLKEYEDENGKSIFKKIPLENLKDEATNATDKKIKVFVPENDVLKKGYVIVDTPGIHSLNEMHDDITFGYLPFVDAAFILIDINQGAVPSSLKRFLKENLLGNDILLSKIRFIINRIDTKTEGNLEKIKQGFIESVKDIIPDPVFLMVSAKEALSGALENNEEKIKKSGIKTLENYLTNYVYKQKQDIEIKRRSKELKKIFANITDILSKKTDAFGFSDEEYKEKLKKITKDQSEFAEKASKLRRAYVGMREKISDRLPGIIDKYAQIMADKLSNDENIEDDVMNMVDELNTFLEQEIKTYFSNYEAEIGEYLPEYFDTEGVKKMKEMIDGITQIVSFLLVAWIMPGARPGIELTEALAGGAEVLIKKIFRNAKNKDAIIQVAMMVGDFVRKIDPAEYVKRLILPGLLKGQIRGKFESRVYNGVNLLLDDIEKNVVEPGLDEIRRKLNELDNMYKETKKEMEGKKFDAKNRTSEIQDDINVVKDCKEAI